MIISTDTEKAYDKFRYPFMTKYSHKLETEWNFFDLIKGIYEKTIANIKLTSS